MLNLAHIYSPPPPPDIAILPNDFVNSDDRGLPILFRHTDTVNLPFVWFDSQGYSFPSHGVTLESAEVPRHVVTPPHVPVAIHLGSMWVENWKSALAAQRQLMNDVSLIEDFRFHQRVTNERIVQILNQATNESLPADPVTCYSWWTRKCGRTMTPAFVSFIPTAVEFVILNDLPRNVPGLGFHSSSGYYIKASTFGY